MRLRNDERFDKVIAKKLDEIALLKAIQRNIILPDHVKMTWIKFDNLSEICSIRFRNDYLQAIRELEFKWPEVEIWETPEDKRVFDAFLVGPDEQEQDELEMPDPFGFPNSHKD
jgi:hypothetical protein